MKNPNVVTIYKRTPIGSVVFGDRSFDEPNMPVEAQVLQEVSEYLTRNHDMSGAPIDEAFQFSHEGYRVNIHLGDIDPQP